MFKCIGALLLACAAGSSMATGQATATLQGLTMTLQDLDAGDGILPSVRAWTPNVHAPFGLVMVHADEHLPPADPWVQQNEVHRFPGWDDAPISVQAGSVSADASIGDRHCCDDLNGLAMRTSAGLGAAPAGASTSNGESQAYAENGYFVSAHTSLSLSATFNVATFASQASAPGALHVKAYAQGSLAIWSGSSERLDYQELVAVSDIHAPGTASDARSATLGVSFVNATDHEVFIFVDASSYSLVGRTLAAPVPEPASAAFMVIGLAAMGLGARRRTRQPLD